MPSLDKYKAQNPGTRIHIQTDNRKQTIEHKAGVTDRRDDGGSASTTGQVTEVDQARAVGLPEENAEPLRRRFSYRRKRPRWVRMAAKGLQYAKARSPWRELSREELQEQAEWDERKALEALLRSESERLYTLLQNSLAGIGLCYRRPKLDQTFLAGRIDKVQFSHVVFNEDAIYFRIDTKRLPFGLGILDIVGDEKVITHLSISCGHSVHADFKPDTGAWLVVERAVGIRGIPSEVGFNDSWLHIPRVADTFTIPLGTTTNRRRVYRSLVDMPHLLVAGSTSAGKSNFVNAAICTLIMRNTPDQLRLLMIDLKGGLEFAFYKDVPNLLPIEYQIDIEDEDGEVVGAQAHSIDGIVEDKSQVFPLLKWLEDEAERRMAFLRKKGYKKLGDYNKRRKQKNRKPRILLVIDEWANIMLDPKFGKKAENILTDLAARGRAVGIHILLATQTPTKQVVTTLIKSNLNARAAFSTDQTGSMVILRNGSAHRLAPVGRFVWQWGTEEFQIQAPLIRDPTVKRIVAAAINNQTADLTEDILEDGEIFLWALQKLNGRLPFSALWNQFKGRITQADLKKLLIESNDQELEIDGRLFKVITGAGNRSRRLEPVDANPEQ